MNIQDKLNELRKIVGRKTSAENNANADLSKVRQEDKTESDASNNVIKPIEIPCKNYTDENGHFAYIDVQTDKVVHVNLESEKIYTEDEVNQLSLKQITDTLSDDYKELTWQDVVNIDTLYDKFNRPAFTLQEVEDALKKKNNRTNTNDETTNSGDTTTEEKLISQWGLPL